LKRLPFIIIVVFIFVATSCLKPYSGERFSLTPPEKMGKIVSYKMDTESGKEMIAKITVSGNHYEMGYQQGYLLYEGVKKTTDSGWLISIGDVFLGGMIKNSEYLSARKNEIVELLGHFARKERKEIPTRYMEQMQGIADGAIAHFEEINNISYEQLISTKGKSLKERKADREKIVEIFGYISGDRVMLTNMLFDTLMALGYPIEIPALKKEQNKFDVFYASLGKAMEKIASTGKKALEMEEFTTTREMHACDGVIVSGDAAENGELYHSRSFMIPAIIGNELVYIETQPTANYYKTLNLAIPSFVGSVTAMNEKGLSVGLDMVPTKDATYREVGMGSILKLKIILEECGTLAQAVDKLDRFNKNGQSGTPWLYILAGKVGARGYAKNCNGYKPDDWGGVIYEDSPSFGAARWGDWKDNRYSDNLLSSYNFEKLIKDDSRALFEDGTYTGVLRLINPDLTLQNPDIRQREIQSENNPLLLTVSNVYIKPEVQSLRTTGNFADHDSTYRFEKLTLLARDLLEGRTPNIEGYNFTDDNKIGFEELKYLVNYITPYKKYNPYWNVAVQKQRWNYKDGKKFPKETFDECIDYCGRYYGGGKYVEGSRTVYDNANLKMTSLWGLWESEWVDAEFDSE